MASTSSTTDRPTSPDPESATTRRFTFPFEPAFRVVGWPFGIRPERAQVDVDVHRLRVRFGPWLVETDVTNVEGAAVTGDYWLPKVIGPPHLSLADVGITFATNQRAGACLRFHEPVSGLLPRGLVRIRSLTVTVDDPEGLIEHLVGATSETEEGLGAVSQDLHDELQNCTAAELRVRAEALGLAFTTRHSKAQLIDLIITARGA